MQLARLLKDVTQLPEGTSERQKHIRLTEMLRERHGEEAPSYAGVAKWFERESIPSTWLLRIAALPKRPLNLAQYA